MSKYVIICYAFCLFLIKIEGLLMLKSIQECRDETEIINFFKLRGKNLSIDDVYNLKTSYNNSKTKLNDKSKLTLNQLDKIAGGFYIIKQQKIFKKNKPETVCSLMLGNVPSKYFKDSKGNFCFKEDYIAKFYDSSFIPSIDETHISDKTGKWEPTISFIPIRYFSMRTLPVEILQGVLNFPATDMYSAIQQKNLHTVFFMLTDLYFNSIDIPFSQIIYARFIFNLSNKGQPLTQKQTLQNLLSFYESPRLRS